MLEDGSISYYDEGTPQGGIISPLLSNIYLHEALEALDKWYAEEVRPNFKGRAIMVRFADDVILGFEDEQEARETLERLRVRFETFGLKFHPQKTRLIYFGKSDSGNRKNSKREDPNDPNPPKGNKSGSFDFLGFIHYWAKSHRGYWAVKRKTSSKKFREKLRNMNQWCRKNRHLLVRHQHEKLSQKLKGHYAYYGITGNMKGLQRYLNEVKKIWKKWLCRRCWKGYRLNWEKYNQLLKEHLRGKWEMGNGPVRAKVQILW